jgi:hypothetical protein
MNKDFGMRVETDFYVISQMGKRRFLDIIGRDLVIKTRNGRKTQKWYFHQKSLTIRSRVNNQSWTIGSSGKSNNLQISSTRSQWW